MNFLIQRSWTFDAAHFLPNYSGKCYQLHGHTWKVTLCLKSKVQKDGISVDFAEMDEWFEKEINPRFDHSNLNSFIPNPTCEVLCQTIWDSAMKAFPGKVYQVSVSEGPKSKITLKTEEVLRSDS